MASLSEEQRNREETLTVKEIMHKTKLPAARYLIYLLNPREMLNQYDLLMNSDGDATHEYEYELELISTMPEQPTPLKSNDKLELSERALSAAGAAVLSVVIVNPLDVVKTRLQAQAVGVAYSHPMTNHTTRMAVFGPNMMFADLRCSPSCTRAGVHGTVSICPPDCFEYKGTLDVFYKIIRQEGVARLWRGTNAGLALAVPTVRLLMVLSHYLKLKCTLVRKT